MHAAPEISVVIPTRNRPELLLRAVRSALAQTLPDLEVIVVIDGPDPHTRAATDTIDDPRLRVLALPAQSGAPNARNAGVQAARAPWTAMLDDDDEWLPDKLAVQLDHARHASAPTPVVTTRLVHRTPRADVVLPRRLPAPGEPHSEYFTVRRGLFHGEGFIQTSTIMAPTDLLRSVPFATDVRRMQELDWALRALAQTGTELVVADQPLVIWHADENRQRISTTMPWRESLAWLRRSRHLLTRRAYAALAMSVVSSMAAHTRSPKVFATLLGEAHRHGRPGLIDYLTFLQIWLVPPQLRRTVRDRILSRRDTGDARSSAALGHLDRLPQGG